MVRSALFSKLLKVTGMAGRKLSPAWVFADSHGAAVPGECRSRTTRREIVVAASFRIWPGWRRRRPPDSRAGIWGSFACLASGRSLMHPGRA